MSIGRGKRWRILARDAFTCRYCGRHAPYVALEVDHVVARSVGGADEWDNLVTSCFDCNRGKREQSSLVALSVLNRLTSAEDDVDALDFMHRDAAHEAAYWEAEARRLNERLLEYEVLAEEHGWFDV